MGFVVLHLFVQLTNWFFVCFVANSDLHVQCRRRRRSVAFARVSDIDRRRRRYRRMSLVVWFCAFSF